MVWATSTGQSILVRVSCPQFRPDPIRLTAIVTLTVLTLFASYDLYRRYGHSSHKYEAICIEPIVPPGPTLGGSAMNDSIQRPTRCAVCVDIEQVKRRLSCCDPQSVCVRKNCSAPRRGLPRATLMMYDVCCICGTQRRVEPCLTQIEQDERSRGKLLLTMMLLEVPLAIRVHVLLLQLLDISDHLLRPMQPTHTRGIIT